MYDYISISTLNDYIFCPYSIYLHNVYMEADEGLYHATSQTQGAFAKHFDGGDSVIVFDVTIENLKKYGNAIHRDTDIVYF